MNMEDARLQKLQAIKDAEPPMTDEEIADKKARWEQKAELFFANTKEKSVFFGRKNIVVALVTMTKDYPYLVLSGDLKGVNVAPHDLTNLRAIEIPIPEPEVEGE